jgi:hypothetical protein
MGFDLHGLEPINNNNIKRPEIDWDLNPSKKETEEYFEMKDEFDNKVPGSYFRNNVWWWRPLWEFVCNTCGDILSNEDMESGGYNDGHIIDGDKAIAISNRLNELIEDGFLLKYENDYKKEMKSTPKEPCRICDGLGTRKGWEGWESKEEWLKTHDTLEQIDTDEELVHGLNIPVQVSFKWANEMKGCNSCHGKGTVVAFATRYPFDRDNVVDFSEFCKQSGGFEIC